MRLYAPSVIAEWLHNSAAKATLHSCLTIREHTELHMVALRWGVPERAAPGTYDRLARSKGFESCAISRSRPTTVESAWARPRSQADGLALLPALYACVVIPTVVLTVELPHPDSPASVRA